MTKTPYIARCEHPGCDAPGHALIRYDGSGRPTPDPASGRLYCYAHRPPHQRVQRPVPVSPRDALGELEKTFATQLEALNAAIAGAIEDAVAEAIEALTGKALSALTEDQREIIEEIFETESTADNARDEFRKEIEGCFATLRKALAAQKPPSDQDEPKRVKRRPSAHVGQNGDLLAGGEAAGGQPP